MDNQKFLDILKEAREKTGNTIQIVVTIEEMSELTKELCKYLRYGEDNKEHILEELADVTILLAQISLIFDIKYDELDKMISYKVNRAKERIDNDDKL